MSSDFEQDKKRVLAGSPKRVQAEERYKAMGAAVTWYDNDLTLQNQGIDGIVTTQSGKQKKFDEIWRDVDYGDMLFEYDSGKCPGKFEKNLNIDIIVYHTPERCFILDWKKAKKWWDDNKKRVLKPGSGYHTVSVPNTNTKYGNYTTYSVCVKWSELPKNMWSEIADEHSK